MTDTPKEKLIGHTEGPWEAGYGDGRWDAPLNHDLEQTFTVSIVNEVGATVGFAVGATDEQANSRAARMISQHDLYEALKAITEAWTDPDALDKPAIRQLMKQADDALAKADNTP